MAATTSPLHILFPTRQDALPLAERSRNPVRTVGTKITKIAAGRPKSLEKRRFSEKIDGWCSRATQLQIALLSIVTIFKAQTNRRIYPTGNATYYPRAARLRVQNLRF